MIKRICVVASYSENGIFGEYYYSLLKNAVDFYDRVIVVINGYLDEQSRRRLSNYTEEILTRDNAGFDAMAYKYAISMLLENRELEDCLDLTIMNDSFYGPFISFSEIFSKMNNVSCDFWGLTKWNGGTSKFFEGREIPAHVQSYFINFKETVIKSKAFAEFWSKLEDIHTFKDAVNKFEVSISDNLVKQGFTFKVWTDLYDNYSLTGLGDVVYSTHAYELIERYDMPILKRKAVTVGKFDTAFKAIKYIENRYTYDTKSIIVDAFTVDKGKYLFGFKEIDDFIKIHKKIYVFGAGILSRNVCRYLEYKEIVISGIVVSDNHSKNGEIELSNMKLDKEDGLIVAVSGSIFEEIENVLRTKFLEQQLLISEY